MFIEQGDSQQAPRSWFEDVARRHPRAFTALLVVLAVVVTLGLLYKTTDVTILYQGF